MRHTYGSCAGVRRASQSSLSRTLVTACRFLPITDLGLQAPTGRRSSKTRDLALVRGRGVGLQTVEPFSRRLSPTERIWLVADRLCPPFVNQLVLEGNGTLNEQQWHRAVAVASEANPGSRLVARGFLGSTRWVDRGVCPPVRKVDGTGWQGRGPQGAEFLLEPLPPRKGPTCEVVLVPGQPSRVVFRTHHAVMDGRGTLAWVKDIFRALRAEPVKGSRSTLLDFELARTIRDEEHQRCTQQSLAPTGIMRGAQPGVVWRRISVPGRFSDLLPQTAVLVAREARLHGEGPVRITIPVDLRELRQGLRSTANLTGMIFLEVPEGATPLTVRNELLSAIAEGQQAVLMEGHGAVPHIPLWLMHRVVKKKVKRLQHSSRGESSAIVSNLGLLPLESMKGPEFAAYTAFFIPPGTDICLFFMTLSGSPTGVEIVLSVPKPLATEERLDGALQRIRDGIVPKA